MNLGKESETVEFKESTGEKHQGLESIAAILNKHGYGELFFGVYDNGEVKGQQTSDSTIKELGESISRDIEPRITPKIEVLSFEGKDVVRVAFNGNQKPYSAFGKFQVRVGTQNRIMTRDELIRLIKEEDYSSHWEEQIRSGFDFEDIDDDALLSFYNEAVNCGRLEMGNYDKEELLSALGLISNGRFNNAAYALFGNKCRVGLKVACFATDSKMTFTDLNLYHDNIYNLIKKAIQYISNNIHWRQVIDHKRIEYPEIPIKAIREMVINAFAHATYDPIPEIEVNIYPGSVTIFNPGTFPDDLTPQDFIDRKISSIKRNPLMLDVLFRCKDVEKTGTGFKRMAELCEEENVGWDYEKTPYGFYFTFFRNSNVPLDVPLDVPLKNDLTEVEKQIYMLIKANQRITREEIGEQTGVSVKTVQRRINALYKKGYLIRVGNNRFGYWEILK